MRLIALTSPAGGVGCTTVAAHMALMLQAMGHSCLALELHPRNQLGVHLGLPHPVPSGWVAPAAQGQWWGDAAVAAANGLLFLPYGPSSMAQQLELSHKLLTTPQWLQSQLKALALPADTLVIADVGIPTSPLAWQALSAAHAVVCCTTTTALQASRATYTTAASARARARRGPGRERRGMRTGSFRGRDADGTVSRRRGRA